jgi:ribonuclease J
MRVRIHRGAHEIGGSCVEVEADGCRLVLDVGRPLDAARDEEIALPPVAGFGEADPSLVGVVISHAHQDHWGLVGQVPAGVPLYLGEATHRILGEAAFWTAGLVVEAAGFLAHRKPFEVGPFRVTPFLNDHSAFDAYSVLVECGGKRLFYTGDIRGHGRKGGIFEELLRKPPEDVDVLLMEGTNIRADDAPETVQLTETELEDVCRSTFLATPGMVLAVTSSQNIDRLVTLYRAAKRSGRQFVIDLYTASIARATGNPNIPQPGPTWTDVKVFVPLWQRRKVKDAKEFHRVAEIAPYRVFEEDLAAKRDESVLLFSLASGPLLDGAGCLEGAHAVWSLWSGYLKEASGKRLLTFLQQRNIPLSLHHTSGHASIPDLQRLAKAINPDRVVPIHSFGAHRYSDYFSDSESRPDGTWWEV